MSAESDKAVEALAELVTATMRGKELGRFGKAAQICQLGQVLARMEARTVEDFQAVDDPNAQQQMGFVNQNVGFAQYNPARIRLAGNNFNVVGDGGELVRNQELTAGTLAQVQAEAQRAIAALHEADELKALTALRDTVSEAQRATLDARIAKLFEHMEARNAAHVADTDVSRGHPAGEQGRPDAPPRLRPHVVGGEGNGVLAEARHDAAAAEQWVDVGQRI